MNSEEKPFFPFREGEWYAVSDLKAVAAKIVERTGSDAEFGAAPPT
jgi:hypothetical protein